MDIMKTLLAEGWTPVANEEGGFKPLKGSYLSTLTTLRKEESQFEKGVMQYVAEWRVSETLDGDQAAGRAFFRRYNCDDPKKVKKLLTDLFTMGVELPGKTTEEFEKGFEKAIGKPAFIRGWGWTPEKTYDGKPLAEADRKAKQQFVIVKDLKAKAGAKQSSVPF